MFGAAPPSAEEIALQEHEASSTVKTAILLCATLYVSPFVVDYVYKLL